ASLKPPWQLTSTRLKRPLWLPFQWERLLCGLLFDLRGKLAESTLQTAYYAPDSLLSAWHSFSPAQTPPLAMQTMIEILETTTLAAARNAG
ncbi:hypothetical protein B0H10DRAFT_641922, partial [Mycena sp. CBHHK59/15]